ncbi:sugar ABC transporter permease [Paenibacillus sp. Y412MC10]|uniref:ABC transporter permease n=2 Tax=unclassified Paenibacillus TaxID=185978 RepID=UPI0011AB3001|nr:ABC transporter permease subunit [Paenibacillus sp. Y412MC10]
MSASLTETANSAPIRKRFQIKDRYTLFLTALPFLVLVFLFSYFPLYGWIYALYDYQPGIPLAKTDFVGLQWFTAMISDKVQRVEMFRVLRNTFAISSLGIVTSILPVILAILLTEVRNSKFKRIVQTLTTLPNFISWVLVYSFAFMLFSVNNGFLNHFLMNLGWISSPTNILADDNHVWLVMTLWGVWKGLGWGAIMYIAAITGIDSELYEAARVDGANRFRQVWHVTVPGIIPTYFVLLILSIANFINNGLEQYFVFANALNMSHIEVLDLYVYNIGMGNSNFGFATAVSIMKSIVSLFLLFAANGMSKLIRGQSII